MLAVLALLPLLLTASASPIAKRFTRALIVSGRDGKCLAAAPKTGSGSQVSTVDCNNSNWLMYWDINPGSGSVILSGTNLALDAGSTPGNNGALKVWTSYPGLYQQTWYLTDDNRIAITGGNQCLDEGDNGIQTYQCTTGNTNQVFNVMSSGTPSSSVSPSPSSTSSSTGPTTTSGQKLNSGTDQTQCLTVQGGGNYADGASVQMQACVASDNQLYAQQQFDVPSGNGAIRLHNTNFCLDAGTAPHSGVSMKIWTCYNGLEQQTWTYANGNFMLDNNQCLDRTNGGPGVQTWECFTGNTNQVWSVTN